MKIVIVTNIRVAWGGSEELWSAFAIAAAGAGHEVYVSKLHTPISRKLDDLGRKGIRIIYRRGNYKIGLPLVKRVAIKASIFLRNYLDNPYNKTFSIRPDVIVVNDSSYYIGEDVFFYKKILKSSIPLVIINQIIADFHILNTPEGIKRARNLFISAEKILFVARRNLETAERQLCLPLDKATVVRNPVNLKNISEVPFPGKTDKTHFAIVGNLLVQHKGQDILLAVLSQKKWKDRNWTLNVFGDGQDEHYLKKLCEMYDLKEKVVFRGKTNDIISIWMENECLISTSLMEGTPLVMVEAMLCGRMCIMTDVGGNREWIQDGINGYIAEAPTVYSVDKTLETAWENKSNWKIMGEKARETACGLYDFQPGETVLSHINASTESRTTFN